jgi:hypothetical protein
LQTISQKKENFSKDDYTMDFGRNNSLAVIINPAAGHSPHIDEKVLQWGNVETDILSYLSDVTKLEAFADKAANAEQLVLVLEPFLDNARTYFEAITKLVDGQVTWTELRKQFGSKVASAITKIRKMNAEFGSEMELLDARDRSTMLKIEDRRQKRLAEIAHELTQDLQAQLWQHETKIAAISSKGEVAQKRQSIQQGLQASRQRLLDKARNGTNQGIQDKVPVLVSGNAQSGVSNSVSATGKVRDFSWFSNLINFR